MVEKSNEGGVVGVPQGLESHLVYAAWPASLELKIYKLWIIFLSGDEAEGMTPHDPLFFCRSQ